MGSEPKLADRFDAETLIEVIEMADMVLRERYADLSTCVQQGDEVALRPLLHTLEGEALECGLPVLAESCARVRIRLPQGDWQGELTLLLAELETTLELLSELRTRAGPH